MITDTHHHFYTKEQYEEIYKVYGSPDALKPLLRDFSLQDIEPVFRKLGVTRTVLVQLENSLQHTGELLNKAETIAWIAGVIGWVDLKDPGVGTTLDGLLKKPKFKGIRHPLEHESDPEWITNDDVLSGLRELAKRNIVFDLLMGPRNWGLIPKVIEAVPDLSLVIEHFGKPNGQHAFSEWARMMAVMAQHPRIYCKLSGIMVLIPEENWNNWNVALVKPYIEKTIEVFGVERVMFGSDWPVSTLVGSYEKQLETVQKCLIGLNAVEVSQIMDTNATRIYHLRRV
jgi:L-fuconolactonase